MRGFVSLKSWPEFDQNLIQEDMVNIGVQVNGAKRGVIAVSLDEIKDSAVEKALKIPSVKKAIGGQEITKVIYVPGKILNLLT